MATLKLLEPHIQRAVTDFLQLDGWRAIRTDPVSDRARAKGFGELGMPDYLFVRYWNLQDTEWGRAAGDKERTWAAVRSDVLWIEFKRRGKKPRRDQLIWHDVERKRGALVLVVDDIQEFIAWYQTSGLQRHPESARIALGDRN